MKHLFVLAAGLILALNLRAQPITLASRVLSLENRSSALETNIGIPRVDAVFGSIYEASANGNNIALTTAGVFVPWIGSTVAVTNNINSGGTNITTLTAGYYDLTAETWGLTGVASTNVIMGSLFSNDVRIATHTSIGQAAVSTSLQIGLVINGPPVYLPASARIDFRIANTNGNVSTVNYTNRNTHLTAKLVSL